MRPNGKDFEGTLQSSKERLEMLPIGEVPWMLSALSFVGCKSKKVGLDNQTLRNEARNNATELEGLRGNIVKELYEARRKNGKCYQLQRFLGCWRLWA